MTHSAAGLAGDAGRSRSKRADIQGLRGLAVVAAICHHLGVPGSRGGFVGIDLFFVISGFVITGLLLREHEATGRIDIVAFYARRVRRILPPATLVLAATACAVPLLLSWARAKEALLDIAWAAGSVANLRFTREHIDYFARQAPQSPVQHYWSLAVEEQYYLVWPALLVLALSVRAAARRRSTVGAVVVVVLGLSLWRSVTLTRTAPTNAYFSTSTRVWELAIGALLAVAAPGLTRAPAWLRHLLGWAGLVVICVSVAVFEPSGSVPGCFVGIPAVATAAFIAGGLRTGDEPRPRLSAGAVLSWRPIRYTGDISYSLYLIHWPVLVLAEASLRRSLGPAETLAVAVGTYLLAAASYAYVERPPQRSALLDRHRWGTLAAWPVTVGVVVLLAVGGSRVAAVHVDRANAEAPLPTPHRSVGRTATPESAQVEAAVADAVRAAATSHPYTSITPPVSRLHDDTERGYLDHADSSCEAQLRESTQPRVCQAGDLTAHRVMAVLGDSTARMWVPALSVAATTHHLRVRMYVKPGCTPAAVSVWVAGEGVWEECDAWRRWAVARIQADRPAVVVLAGNGHDFQALRHYSVGGRVLPDTRSELAAIADGMTTTMRQLSGPGRTVALLGDGPGALVDPADCLSQRGSSPPACVTPLRSPLPAVTDAYRTAAQRAGGVFVAVLPWLCAHGRCPAVIDGIATYRDRGHLTATYSAHLGPALAEALRLTR